MIHIIHDIYKKICKKPNQAEFRIEKVRKEKGNK